MSTNLIEISGNKTSNDIRNEILYKYKEILENGGVSADSSITISILGNNKTNIFPSFLPQQKELYPEFFDKVNRIEIMEARKMDNLTYLNVFKNLEFFYWEEFSNKIIELPNFFYTDLKDKLKELFIIRGYTFGKGIININENIKDVKLTKLYIDNYEIRGGSHISNISTLETLSITEIDETGSKPEIDFSKLTNLKKIKFNKKTIQLIDTLEQIQVNDIIKLPNLTSLEICGQKIFGSVQFIEGDLPKIESLIINDIPHPLLFLPTLNKLVTLKKLNLTNNGITYFPNLDKCINLEIINLSFNKINDWEEECIKSLTKLEELYLRNNNIKKIPESLGNLVNLEKFNISYCPLGSISIFRPLNKLIALKELYMKSSNVKVFPNINKCINLEKLDISYNKITVLPSDYIDTLIKLKSLNLKTNYLIKLPNNIVNLSNLEELIIDNNPISTLPSNIYNLDKLSIFTFNNPKLIELLKEMGRIDTHTVQEILQLFNPSCPLRSLVLKAFRDSLNNNNKGSQQVQINSISVSGVIGVYSVPYANRLLIQPKTTNSFFEQTITQLKSNEDILVGINTNLINKTDYYRLSLFFVKIEGEEGIDAGGLYRQYLSDISNEISEKKFFIKNEEGTIVSTENSEDLKHIMSMITCLYNAGLGDFESPFRFGHAITLYKHIYPDLDIMLSKCLGDKELHLILKNFAINILHEPKEQVELLSYTHIRLTTYLWMMVEFINDDMSIGDESISYKIKVFNITGDHKDYYDYFFKNIEFPIDEIIYIDKEEYLDQENNALGNNALGNNALGNNALANNALANNALANNALGNQGNNALGNQGNNALGNNALGNNALANNSLANNALGNNALANNALETEDIIGDEGNLINREEFIDYLDFFENEIGNPLTDFMPRSMGGATSLLDTIENLREMGNSQYLMSTILDLAREVFNLIDGTPGWMDSGDDSYELNFELNRNLYILNKLTLFEPDVLDHYIGKWEDLTDLIDIPENTRENINRIKEVIYNYRYDFLNSFVDLIGEKYEQLRIHADDPRFEINLNKIELMKEIFLENEDVIELNKLCKPYLIIKLQTDYYSFIGDITNGNNAANVNNNAANNQAANVNNLSANNQVANVNNLSANNQAANNLILQAANVNNLSANNQVANVNNLSANNQAANVNNLSANNQAANNQVANNLILQAANGNNQVGMGGGGKQRGGSNSNSNTDYSWAGSRPEEFTVSQEIKDAFKFLVDRHHYECSQFLDRTTDETRDHINIFIINSIFNSNTKLNIEKLISKISFTAELSQIKIDLFKEILLDFESNFSDKEVREINLGLRELLPPTDNRTLIGMDGPKFFYNQEDFVKKLLEYWTGSRILSIEDYRISYRRGLKGIESHTCFNQLVLGDFVSKKDLLLLIMKTIILDDGAFGIGRKNSLNKRSRKQGKSIKRKSIKSKRKSIKRKSIKRRKQGKSIKRRKQGKSIKRKSRKRRKQGKSIKRIKQGKSIKSKRKSIKSKSKNSY